MSKVQASTAEPPELVQWDLSSGQKVRSQKQNCDGGIVHAVAYNPNGHSYVTICGGHDISQRTLRIAEAERIATQTTHAIQ